jgi:O-antigen/teichoic acid export membrane protein
MKENGDMTGRDRILRNTLSSWGGQLVFVVAGFLMPRMIDHYTGQVSLGIWDFSWSLVSYFGLASLGVGSSVNRYVARFRAAGETDKLNEAISSVVYIQIVVACLAAMLTAASVLALPHFFKDNLGKEMGDAQWVVGLLGASLAVQMLFDTSRGIITGCHRWDLHNAINSLSYGITVIGMVILLILGGGLRGLGAVYLAVMLVTEICRYRLSRKTCPELRIRFRYASWNQAREMFSFGVKTIIIYLCPLILVQGSSILVARHLGPSALAVFSRPSGLLRNALVFVAKYAMILTPTAGSLQSAGMHEDIRTLIYKATRNSLAMTLPIVLLLAFLGGPLLQVWMGPRYEGGQLMAILAIGSFLPMTMQPVMAILAGMNSHGIIGKWNLLLTILTMGIGWGVMNFMGWSLTGGALLVAASATLANGVTILLYACWKFKFSLREYLRESFVLPLLACIPLALFLMEVRSLLSGRPFLAVMTGGVGSVAILVPIYWKYIIGQELQSRILGKAEKYGLVKKATQGLP